MAAIELRSFPFSEQALYSVLENPHTNRAEIASRAHARYLFHYLSELHAGSIISESPYIDGDYLDDFATYYVRCFTPYLNHCKRLHFFVGAFAHENLTKITSGALAKEDLGRLQQEYLGFIVARPLPQAVIGRTALKTFDGDKNRRHYPCLRLYRANLVGIQLSVESLAFQEQDTVLAACATVALWTSFQKTADLFGSTAPSPAVITRASQAIHLGRSFPSQGLSVLEICTAIRHVGLEPELFDLQHTPPVPLVSLLYSYLRFGLPIILVANVPGGLHAITLNGYSLRNDPVRTTEIIGDKPAIPMNGLRIDKFYGHDDQLGPFCRLVVQDAPANSPYPIQFLREGTIAHPIAVIIPVYNKVRLTFLDVQMWISRIHQVLKILVRPTSTVEWNIGLLFSNDYKRAVRESELLSDDLKRAIVMSALPRFVWYCALSVDGRIVVDFIIDATGLARSFPVYLIAWRDASLAAAMVKLMNVASLEKTLRGIFSDRFFDFLKSSLRDGLPVTRIF
jgi:hypothetical protein